MTLTSSALCRLTKLVTFLSEEEGAFCLVTCTLLSYGVSGKVPSPPVDEDVVDSVGQFEGAAIDTIFIF